MTRSAGASRDRRGAGSGRNEATRLSSSRVARRGSALSVYGLVQPGGGVAVVGRPGGPECLWFVSPQPQPGRVPAPAVPSLGAAARALTLTSVVSVVSVVVVSRSAIDSFAVAIPFADFSRATDDACSASETVHAVPVSPAETEALVAREAFSSRVAAPAI